jgi:bifunctional UDP-N-acetylglucosamine pyrophosphorylase / glucosamine-1-phosphate N-acetyltransferase
VKNSTVGSGSKVPHLSYIGDTIIGTGSNIGAGTITANYDGDHKFATVIGDRSFVGSNSTLVAPVTIHDGGYVAAGSTVTTDVGPGDLAVARGRQRDVTGWTVRRRPGSASAAAASLALAAQQRTSDPAEFEPANPSTSGSKVLTHMDTTPTSSTGTTPAEGDQPA